ncbi:PGF-pre-PGF domain-containing protein [Halanaeroarchaeum sulfurireducens]|nr:PGF-pre-PGF domain-containing protein [Halanaeroarchaeum sulfurireducens]
MIIAAVGVSLFAGVTAASPADTSFESGNGTAENPYEVSNWTQLADVNEDPTAHYVLVNDLNKSTDGYDQYANTTANNGSGWVPLGNSTTTFTGTFNGQWHTIDGLYIDRPDNLRNGLFGHIGSGGEVTKVGVTNVNITADQVTGALAGRNNGLITNSYATGEVDGVNGERIGGLVGYNEGDGTIENSFSRVNVTSTAEKVGGLVGDNSNAIIKKSYSTGYVDASAADTGGLTGREDGSTTVVDSFWDTETSEQSSSAGGTGKTTAEMKNVSTFTDTGTDGLTSPWDFVNDPNGDTATADIWAINTSVNDGYPNLQYSFEYKELPYVIMNEGDTDEYKLYIVPKDTGNNKVWGGFGTEVGADAQSATDGTPNTDAIVEAYGESEPYEGATDYAAKLSTDLDEYGYNDWFLPAKDQASAIFNKTIYKGGYESEWEAFGAADKYWTSTEVGPKNAHIVRSDGDNFTGNKDNLYRVRAVRRASTSTSTDDTAAWDITTAKYTGISTPTQDTGPEGIHFSPDGKTMYEMGYSDEGLYQYELSEAWNISTASHIGDKDTLAESTDSSDLFISPDETNLYEVDKSGGVVYQFGISNGDIDTKGGVPAEVATQSSDPEDIHFSSDGTKMYELGPDTVYEYDLSTPWDVSTADHVGATENTVYGSATGLFFHPDGEKMYVLGEADDKIHQFSLGTAWDLSTASPDDKSVNIEQDNAHSLYIGETNTGSDKLFFTDRAGEAVYQYSVESTADIESIEVKTQPTLDYDSGDSLDLSGMEITENYTDGTTKTTTYGDAYWNDNYNATPSNGTALDDSDHGKTVAITHISGEETHTNTLAVNTVVESINVTSQPNTLTYNSSESLNLSGLEVEMNWSDGTLDENISYANFSSYGLTADPDEGDTLDETDENVTVTHTESGETSDTNNLTVNSVIESINVTTQPTLNYNSGDTLNLSGMVINETYTNGTEVTVTFNDSTDSTWNSSYTADPANGTALDNSSHGKTVAITHTNSGEETYTNMVNMTGDSVKSINVTAEPTNLVYDFGDSLNLSGLEVEVKWTNSTLDKNVSYANFSSYGLTAVPDEGDRLNESDDNQPITVTHTESEKTNDTNNLTVNAVIESISVTSQPNTLSYNAGDTLNLSGMVINETYTNGTEVAVTFNDSADSTWNSSYTADPANGTALDNSSHGKTVAITHTNSGEETYTNKLTLDAVIESISVTSQPNTLTYTSGDTLNLSGLEASVNWDGGTSDENIPYANFSSYGLTAVPDEGDRLNETDDNQPITVSHTQSGETNDTDTLTVDTVVKSIVVTSQPDTHSYNPEESLDLSGLEVRIDWTNGTSDENIPYADFDSHGLTANPDEGDTLDETDDGEFVIITHTESGETADTTTLAVKAESDDDGSVITGGGGGGGLTSIVSELTATGTDGQATVTIDGVSAGGSVNVQVSEENTETVSLQEVSASFDMGTNVDNQMTVEASDSPPEDVPEPEGGTNLGYTTIEIEGNLADSVTQGKFTFNIDPARLEEMDAAPEDVSVMRHHDGEWQEVTTTSIDDTTYRVTTPGYSTFAITVAQTADMTTTETTTVTETETTTETTTAPETTAVTTTTTATSTSTPGFGPVVAVIALLVSLLITRKRA